MKLFYTQKYSIVFFFKSNVIPVKPEKNYTQLSLQFHNSNKMLIFMQSFFLDFYFCTFVDWILANCTSTVSLARFSRKFISCGNLDCCFSSMSFIDKMNGFEHVRKDRAKCYIRDLRFFKSFQFLFQFLQPARFHFTDYNLCVNRLNVKIRK